MKLMWGLKDNFRYKTNNGRCIICGAKKEVHYEEHCCRFHKDENGICDVCGKNLN